MIRNYKRKLAILLSPLVAILIASAPTFPAAEAVAAPEHVEAVVAGQSLTVDASVVVPDASRDDYTITYFTPVQWPVPSNSKINSGFGYRIAPCSWGCSSYHQGVDFGGPAGESIEAIAPGVVVFAGCQYGGLGCYVEIAHDINGTRVHSIYGHMLQGSIAVSQGQKVQIGQHLGGLGSTGVSTGLHLHFGVSIGGVMIDPLHWIKKNALYSYYEVYP